jgi:hypothetical protein
MNLFVESLGADPFDLAIVEYIRACVFKNRIVSMKGLNWPGMFKS